MFVPPIIERELRFALRNRRAVDARSRVARIVAGVVCLFFMFGWLTGNLAWGKTLHGMLLLVGFILAVLPAAQVSVGLFCEERRNQTLELLYLAGLGSGELFVEKLLGGLLVASSGLLAVTPFLAVPFLTGGVSLDLFLATIGCFPVLLLFTVSVGVLASVLNRDDGAALVCAVIIGGVVCLALVLPYYLGTNLAGAPPFSSAWLRLSPAYAAYLVATNFAGASPRIFWETSGVTLVWSFIFLCAAAVFLNRNWRQDMVRSAPVGWRGNWASWLYGTTAWRRKLRAEVLPQNAFQWLAQRDRQPVLVAWGGIGGIVFFWLLGCAAWPKVWPTPMNLYLTALLLMILIFLTIRYAAARAIGTERREGALELLLTTPLNPQVMVEGQLAAVRAQFRPVQLALMCLFGLMMLAGFYTRTWTSAAMIDYFVIWFWFILWSQFVLQPVGVTTSMWIALNTGRPTSAILMAHRQNPQSGRWAPYYWVYMFVFNFWNVWRGLRGATGFPSGSYFEMICVWLFTVWGLIAVGVIMFKHKTEFSVPERMIKEMRWIARQPLPDPKDPLYAKWSCLDAKPLAAGFRMEMVRSRVAEPGWFQKLGGAAGRQLGRGWVYLRERRRGV